MSSGKHVEVDILSFSEEDDIETSPSTNSVAHSNLTSKEVNDFSAALFKLLQQVITPKGDFQLLNNMFYLEELPEITLEDFIERIIVNMELEESTIVILLIYIDRLCFNSEIVINEFNIFKILSITALEAVKYNQDKVYNLNYYSSIIGITVGELLELELKFLDQINFNLFISEEEFQDYNKEFQKMIISI